MRELMPELIVDHGSHRDGALVLRADYSLIFARKP